MDKYFVNSAELKQLRATLRTFPALEQQLGRPIEVSLVVDANIIIGEILWLVSKRKNPSAKTRLQETIDAGTIRLCAPTFLSKEIEKHLPQIAKDKGISLNAMIAEWQAYQEKINLIEVPEEELYEPDIEDDEKDIPYLVLKNMVGADAILSKDTDIPRMGGTVLKIELLASLQTYSRACAITYNIRINGRFLAGMSLGVLQTAFEGVKALYTLIVNLPRPAQIALGGAAIALIAYPKSRKAITDFLVKSYDVSADMVLLLLDIVAESQKVTQEQQKLADEALSNLPTYITKPETI